jgi:hypothetical protein
MAEIKILKAKIVKKETLSVEYSREEKDKSITIVSEEHRAPIHQDLKNAFIGLHIHFAILSDYVRVKQVKDIDSFDSDLIEGFSVSCLHKGGTEDESYIILTGSKITASGRAVTINTPILKIEEESEKGYKYLDELLERVEHVENEVKEYLRGKHAPETQTSLNFDEPITKAKIVPSAHLDPSMNSPEGIAAAIVAETNGGIKKSHGRPKKVPQSSKHPSGEVHE